MAASLVILTLFLPSLTALILCKISREGCDNLMILPNIRKAWKAYLFAVIGALVMNYLNELLMYFMFRERYLFMQEHLPCVDWERFLVYLTKRSTSLFPAAVVHDVTNLLPALVVYSDSIYQAHIVPMNGAGLVSAESVIC